MKNTKIIEVLNTYETALDWGGWEPKPVDLEEEISGDAASKALAHVRWMIPKIKTYLAEGRRDKALCWLGFVQGVLWRGGICTIDTLIDHNSTGVVNNNGGNDE